MSDEVVVDQETESKNSESNENEKADNDSTGSKILNTTQEDKKADQNLKLKNKKSQSGLKIMFHIVPDPFKLSDMELANYFDIANRVIDDEIEAEEKNSEN